MWHILLMTLTVLGLFIGCNGSHTGNPAQDEFESAFIDDFERAGKNSSGTMAGGVDSTAALDGDDQDSARRVLKTRHEPSTVLVEMRLCAVAKNLERRQGRAFILDDAPKRRFTKGPVRWG